MLLRASFLIFPALLSLLMSACASVPMASPEEDAAAKAFNSPADKSRIYLYRNEALGSAVKVTISLDGRVMGQTAQDTYFAWNVEPGSHEVSCLTAESNETMPIETKKGVPVYVWQEMKMGVFSARCSLHVVSQAEGQKGVNECKLAQSHQ